MKIAEYMHRGAHTKQNSNKGNDALAAHGV